MICRTNISSEIPIKVLKISKYGLPAVNDATTIDNPWYTNIIANALLTFSCPNSSPQTNGKIMNINYPTVDSPNNIIIIPANKY